MRLVPLVFRFMESRVGSPFWRHFTHVYERWEELRARLRMRRQARSPASAPLADRFCKRPFESFELQENGSVYLCCPTWLRTRAGNLHAESAAAIWNSPAAQAVRAGIHDGSFRHCNHAICPDIQAGTLPLRRDVASEPRWREIVERKQTEMPGIPAFLNLSNDKSCNLACPSCRTDRIQFNSGPGYEARLALQKKLEAAFFAEPTGQDVLLSVTGSGDPFASRIFRDFLFGLDAGKFPGLSVNLQTNGTLFTEKTWNNMAKLHGHVGSVLVSLDAASAATYAIVRRGGDWDHLMANLDFLAGLRRDGKIHELILFFVAQQANFREMPDFARLGIRLGADRITFQRAVNWGTWSRAEHAALSVWNPGHPDHAAFAAMMADPVFAHPSVFLGNLAQARPRRSVAA
jgi:MoaA/NifB/PqqE/SkfB family radical SAM enzyme